MGIRHIYQVKNLGLSLMDKLFEERLVEPEDDDKLISEEEYNRIMKKKKLSYKEFLKACDYQESKRKFK